MNSRTVSLVLVVVTVLLLGTVGYMVYLSQADPMARSLPTVRLITNTVTQIAVRKINATNLLMALASRPASWASLESTNYFVYMANLRGFGCPEETVRDIILTDICKMFTRRRAQLRAEIEPRQYWRAMDPYSTASLQLAKQLKALEDEQHDLVEELLGVDFKTEIAKYWNNDASEDQSLDFLPEAKQDEVRALQRRFDGLEQEIMLRGHGLFLAEDQDRINELRRQREAEMTALMSPEEMEQYLLRNSPTAENLRSQLIGFDVSEGEFRKIFQLQKAIDDQFTQVASPDDEGATVARAQADLQAREAMDEEMKKMLGEQRFNEYTRTQDPDYRSLLQLSERFQVAPDFAAAVHEMKKEALNQRDLLMANANLSDEDRQAALAGIMAATRKAVSDAMPAQVFKAYQQVGGQWFNDLAGSADVIDLPPGP